jgi:hypothetical protein
MPRAPLAAMADSGAENRPTLLLRVARQASGRRDAGAGDSSDGCAGNPAKKGLTAAW